jgi:hypothetical protein
MIGVVGALLTVLVVSGLVLPHLQGTHRAPTTAGSEATYAVAAIVEIQTDGSTDICYPWFNLSYPQSKCSFTVPLQIDMATLPRTRTLQDGTVWTSPLALAGIWTGKSLLVKSTPKPANDLTMPASPGWKAGAVPSDPPESYVRNQSKLTADKPTLLNRGLWVAESGWSNAGFYIILVAADQQSIDYVKHQYSADVVVSWFHLVA